MGLAQLKEEIENDPKGLGYDGKSVDEITALLNEKTIERETKDTVAGVTLLLFLVAKGVLTEKDAQEFEAGNVKTELISRLEELGLPEYHAGDVGYVIRGYPKGDLATASADVFAAAAKV